MAGLYAMTYPDHATAEGAMVRLKGLEEAGYLRILERALVLKDDKGNVDINETLHPVRDGALTGGVIGALAGLIFLAPIPGAAVGAAIGGLIGNIGSSGANSDFEAYAGTIKRELPNGGAAVVVLGASDARERVIQNLGEFGGTVHSFDIPDDDLAKIQNEVDRLSSK